ncbi:hypothetical protein [Lentzea sp. NEAU-D7]|uniref:hypothetical protein n=1 Tax=Lentzea sp. NEAU-D7 TaxID=2994667 RepID=UPI00224A9F39|nr:hypothetical protein [Lentzea sp. NEAU-D7]MCX2951422.1 hypothetical protein [Lentzea sp. NEAU-D7]
MSALLVGVATGEKFGPLVVTGLGGVGTHVIDEREKGCPAVDAGVRVAAARRTDPFPRRLRTS